MLEKQEIMYHLCTILAFSSQISTLKKTHFWHHYNAKYGPSKFWQDFMYHLCTILAIIVTNFDAVKIAFLTPLQCQAWTIKNLARFYVPFMYHSCQNCTKKVMVSKISDVCLHWDHYGKTCQKKHWFSKLFLGFHFWTFLKMSKIQNLIHFWKSFCDWTLNFTKYQFCVYTIYGVVSFSGTVPSQFSNIKIHKIETIMITTLDCRIISGFQRI